MEQHCILEWIKQDSSKGQCPMCRQSEALPCLVEECECVCVLLTVLQDLNGTRGQLQLLRVLKHDVHAADTRANHFLRHIVI